MVQGNIERMKTSTVIFSAANLFGIFLYCLFVAGISWQVQKEQRDYDFGDSLKLIFTAVPVFFLCLAMDVVWSVMALVAFYRQRDYHEAGALLIISAVWVLAILFMREMP
jgi:hypothetical protein